MARLNERTKLKMLRLVREGYTVREISKELGVPYSTVYSYHGKAVLKSAFPNKGDRNGLSLDEFVRTLGVSDSKTPRVAYYEERAKENGYESHAEYVRELAEARQERNKRLSALIKARLKTIGKNQNWLAKTLGVSRQSVSEFGSGKSRPRFELLPLVADALRVDFETLIRLGRYR